MPDTGMPDDLPITGHYRGYPLPDLRLIPPDRWFAALAPLDRAARIVAVSQSGMHELDDGLNMVFLDLMSYDSDRAAARHRGVHASTPPPAGGIDAQEAERERRRYAAGSRQVNLRFVPEDYAALATAAREHGLRPTQLARLLIVNGLRRIEYERRRLSAP